MGLSEFTIRVFLIFIPGLIAEKIIDTLTFNSEKKTHLLFINALLLGFICYSIYYLIYLIPNFNLTFSFGKNFLDSSSQMEYKEIIITTIISIPTGFFVSYLINKRVIFSISNTLRISQKLHHLDVWTYLMISEDKSKWVFIKIQSQEFIYRGWVEQFSLEREYLEILLKDVTVLKSGTSEVLYKVSAIYMCPKRNEIVISFADEPSDDST